MKSSKVVRRGLIAGLLLLGAMGCGEAEPESEQVSVKRQALTGTETARVLGFEDALDWVLVTGSATLSSEPTAQEGSASLGVTGAGYSRFWSRGLTTFPLESDQLTVEFFMPALPVPPDWVGQIQLFLQADSVDQDFAWADQIDLSTIPVGDWSTLEFTIPPDIMAKLQSGPFDDLHVMFALNVPWNAGGTYLFDDLRIGEFYACKARAMDGGGSTAPVDITTEPQVGSDLSILPLLPIEAGQQSKSQLSLRLDFTNNASTAVVVDDVIVSFPGAHPTRSYDVDVCIEAGAQGTWFFEETTVPPPDNDNILLTNPPPTQAGITVSFENYNLPTVFTRTLADHEAPLPVGAYGWPGYGSDLDANEYWDGAGALHAPAFGGHQLYALDLGVRGEDGSLLNPMGEWETKEEHRIWDIPIRAMADGVVVSSLDGFPDSEVGESLCGGDDPTDPTNPLCGPGTWVFGNHFIIDHGTERAVYAHLQESTLDAALMPTGTVVKKGDLLGRIGNSGNTSHPHLHIHVTAGNQLRPIPFRNIFAVSQAGHPQPDLNTPWSFATAHGLPPEQSLIWPGMTHPEFRPVAVGITQTGPTGSRFTVQRDMGTFLSEISQFRSEGWRMASATTYNEVGNQRWGGAWVPGNWDEEFTPGLPLPEFVAATQALFDERGLRLVDVDTYVEGGQRLFSGISRAGTWANFIIYDLDKTQFVAEVQRRFDEEGLVPAKAVPYEVGGQQRWFGIVRSGFSGGLLILDRETEAFADEVADLADDGWRIHDATSYVEAGTRFWAGVLLPGTHGQILTIVFDVDQLVDGMQKQFDISGLVPMHVDIAAQ